MSDKSSITISKEYVREEGEALSALANELAARQDRFSKLIEYLRAIGREDWIPPSADAIGPSFKPVANAPAKSGTWTSEMLRELEDHPNGITLASLLPFMRRGPIAARVNGNPNGIYNAASKLESAGKLVKYKGRVFLPSHYKEFRERVKAGEVEDYEGDGEKTIADILVEFISEQHDGVEAGDIVSHMTEKKGLSSGSVYNTLSKIAARGRVKKEGKLYLPSNVNGEASASPEAEGVTAPSSANP